MRVGDYVNAKVPAHGVRWDPATGWSSNPGWGRARVLAVHEDGSVDLEVPAPRPASYEQQAEPAIVRGVPCEPVVVEFGEPDRLGNRTRALGPTWWPIAPRP